MENQKNILIIIISFIFFFLSLLFVREYHLEYIKNNGLTSKVGYFDKKFSTQKEFDIVAFGDSRTEEGLSGKAFREKNIPFYNNAFSATGHHIEALELCIEKLKLDGKKYLILGVSPRSFLEKSIRKNEYLTEKRNRQIVQKSSGWRAFFSKKNWYDAISTMKGSFLRAIKSQRNTYYADGWINKRPKGLTYERCIDEHKTLFTKGQVSPQIIDNVLQFIRKYTKQEFTIFCVRVPAIKELEDLENRMSGYVEAQIQQRLIKAGGVWVDIENRYQYTSYDGSHLDVQSAIKFSEYLANEIYQYDLKKLQK